MKKAVLILFLAICSLANAQYTKLLDFTGTPNGRSPEYCSLISDGTYLYGTTRRGGANNLGLIFKIKPDGTGYVNLLDFDGASNGSNPYGSLITDGIYLYGMTQLGGANGMGVIYKILPDGTGYTKLLDFAGTANGAAPFGSLTSDGTYLYGMTYQGGTSGMGVVFKILPDGTGYSKLLDFAGITNGSYPRGSLISDGTFLYGMTYRGGTADKGVIFKMLPDGTGYTKLLDFTGTANGGNPIGSLYTDGTYLYGMSLFGGVNDLGTIFRILPDGTGYTSLMDFGGTVTENQPYGTLVSDGTFLYGMTYFGGTYGGGVIFKILPDGTGYNKFMDFAGATSGGNPMGSLLCDGAFVYGMTNAGGTNNYGVVFKYQVGFVGVDENNSANGISVFPNPFSVQTSLQSENMLNNATLTLENTHGQTVKQDNNISGQTIVVDRGGLVAGCYFFRLTEGDRVITSGKLIVTD